MGLCDRRDHKMNKTGLTHLRVSKEVPTRYHYGKIPLALSKKSAGWGASLKCLALMHAGWGINKMS